MKSLKLLDYVGGIVKEFDNYYELIEYSKAVVGKEK